MKIVIPRETAPQERRVALVPDQAGRLTRDGWEVRVERGAGVAAGFSDQAYADAGAQVLDPAALYAGADVVLRVQPPSPSEVALLPEGAVLIAFLAPYGSPELVASLAARRVSALAMELVPRITRAQAMDALSSQATVAGYRAALLAAVHATKFFPMLTTAAGTVAPARVLVLGAGVAGLTAIATARRLGAVVEGFDIRSAAKEQVESLGARWVGVVMEEAEGAGGYAQEVGEEARQREQAHLARLVAEADVVITTAQVPGRRAPLLVTEAMVAAMRPGSVVVDLAADSGGNCALTVAGTQVEHHGVVVIGPVNLPATLPLHASQMYARNVSALLNLLVAGDGTLALDFDDEIVRACCVTHAGAVVHDGVRAAHAAAA